MKAIITNWQAIWQAIRVFLYTVLPLIGVEAAKADNWIVTAGTVLGLAANIYATIHWNKTQVATIAGMEQKGMITTAMAVETAKKQL